ncbi:MAG: S-layer homology domain-containing protein, partial [Clostridia bacterium]|nr:S-layer homology domain-containing protein [Clostridia bacterium]
MGAFSGNRCFKTSLVLVLILVFLLNTVIPAFAFPDVEEHWAQQDITLLTAKGLIGGYPDGSFRPERGVTRAEFARMLISALNMEESAWALEGGSQLFRDVPLTHWARVYIQLAWELGIVAGYKDG